MTSTVASVYVPALMSSRFKIALLSRNPVISICGETKLGFTLVGGGKTVILDVLPCGVRARDSTSMCRPKTSHEGVSVMKVMSAPCPGGVVLVFDEPQLVRNGMAQTTAMTGNSFLSIRFSMIFAELRWLLDLMAYCGIRVFRGRRMRRAPELSA